MLSSKVISSNALSNTPTALGRLSGVVHDVILDETHPYVKDSEFPSMFVGGILVRKITDISNSQLEYNFAYPLDVSVKSLPTKNETVQLFISGGVLYYRRYMHSEYTNINASDSVISSIFTTDDTNTTKKKDYSKTRKTGIPRSNIKDEFNFNEYGDYFKSDLNIHKLRFYEGDTLIESRFGQSIRLSGYNNSSNELSPTIVIRNRESEFTKFNEDVKLVTEDINRDGSSIVLASNKYILPFLPGVLNDTGISDFQTKPKSFKNYPTNLSGDQILINSGRIILSSKNAEFIVYSKKNYGFISDGGLSIDNKGGIDINVGGDISITTNNRSIQINSGNGKIQLGSSNLESMVKGDTLLRLLNELVDLLVQQVYLTPSGPTSTGPTNLPQFTALKAKLNRILSTLNKTA